MDFPDRTQMVVEDLAHIYQDGEVVVGPTLKEIMFIFGQIKLLIETHGSEKFCQNYIQLLKESKITLLNISYTFSDHHELWHEFDQQEKEYNRKIINTYPDFFDVPIPDDKLWEVPYHIDYTPIRTKYWEDHSNMCVKFYEDNLYKLTQQQLINGMKRAHSGSKSGLSSGDVSFLQMLLS